MKDLERINRYILEEVTKGNFNKDIAFDILEELNITQKSDDHDVAVIGLACKFPCSDNADEFWNNLKDGKMLIREYPKSRFKDTQKQSNRGGWLENIADFDASFFNITPKEATCMHPSQRLFLETTWEALEDSGYAGNSIKKSKTGIYVGIDHTYQMEYNDLNSEQSLLTMTGTMTSILSSRLSYFLNLHGPCITVDTACSSGLVATHLACQAIRNNECEMAISGGINLLRQIDTNLDRVESADSQIRAFDKNAQGTTWGEGVGFLVLKSLKQAVEDGDNIYAVVKGSAINNDGLTSGITAPSVETQADVIIRAWEDSGVDPKTISYMEAHATGTSIGDPIEVKGIKMAFEQYTDKKQFCGIGSVKPNIGHAVSAAAMSSIIKVILAMKNKKMPPNINFNEPNPFIDFTDSPVYVNDKLTDWVTDGYSRRAGISSFGFSRTNCHMLLEEAPKRKQIRVSENDYGHLFVLSARSQSTLTEYLKKYVEFFKKEQQCDIKDLCYTACTGRLHLNFRLAIVAKSCKELCGTIKKIIQEGVLDVSADNIFYGEHKVISDNLTCNVEGMITNKEKRILDQSMKKRIAERKDVNNQVLMFELCMAYIKGAEIDWIEYYKGEELNKISLPTYPFEKKHYWLVQDKNKQKELAIGKSMHPLIDKCLVKTMNQEVYLTELYVDKQWVLTEHIILGKNVVPGTTYLEMAVTVGRNLCPSPAIELKNVMFLSPIIVDKDKIKIVHTIVDRNKDNLSFRIVSLNDENRPEREESWSVHVQGTILPIYEIKREKKDICQIREQCNKGEILLDLDQDTGGFTFGPRWRNIDKIYNNKREMFTELSLKLEFWDDIQGFTLHPALLDNAINQAVEQIVQNIEGGLYLPLSFQSVKIYEKMPGKFYSHQKINTMPEQNIQSVSLDVSLLKEDGEIFAEFKGYTIKKVKQEKFGNSAPVAEFYHQRMWIAKEIYTYKEDVQGSILILKDNCKLADQTAELLRESGRKIIEVVTETEYKQYDTEHYSVGTDEESMHCLIKQLEKKNLSMIIDFRPILKKLSIQSLAELNCTVERNVSNFLNLHKALMLFSKMKNVEVIQISEYVNEVVKEEVVLKPQNAPVFAMGRVANQENKGVHIRGIDIDSETKATDLVEELKAVETSYFTAYRSGHRFVESFCEASFEENDNKEEVVIKENGVYVITGGTNGIGLEVASHLASISKINLVLISRSGFPQKDQWDTILEKKEDQVLYTKIHKIQEMEKNGTNVCCKAVELSNEADVIQLVNSLKAEYGQISGVIHCAGIPGGCLLRNQSTENIRRVAAPKIEGTWLLYQYLKEEQLDFFIMFSSILSFFGVIGQSDYAAANAFMDSFAPYARKQGVNAGVINWTVWKETGMAAGSNADVIRGIFKSITNQEGMEALDKVIAQDIVNLAVGEFDVTCISSIEHDVTLDLDKELKRKLQQRISRTNTTKECIEEKNYSNILIKNQENVSEMERRVSVVWAKALELDEIGIFDSFIELGGDSIIAANLLSELDKEFPEQFDMADIFAYPTIKQMADYLTKNDEAIEENIIHQDFIAHEKMKNDDAKDAEHEIEEIMNRLARGEISTEDAERLIAQYE